MYFFLNMAYSDASCAVLSKTQKTKVSLRDIPKLKRLPARVMSKQDMDSMRQWASEHGKAARELSVRQNNTKLITHAAGTLNMYRKELPIGDRVTDDIGDQLSEYDSDASDDENSATHQEEAVEAVPVNFLPRAVCTRKGRPSRCRIARYHTEE